MKTTNPNFKNDAQFQAWADRALVPGVIVHTIAGVAISDAEYARLKQAIEDTWQQIAHDLGDVEDNEEAIECCIDANRLMLNGNSEASDKLVRAIASAGGYRTLKRRLLADIKLV